MIKEYKAVFFDLDGTILNTLSDIADAVNYTLRHFGYPQRTLDEIRQFTGNGQRTLCSKSLPFDDQSKLDDVVAFYEKYYNDHSAIKTCVYDGMRDLVLELQTKGVFVAVLSNKPDQTTKKTVASYIDESIYAVGETADVRRKPAPDGLFKMLNHFGINKEDAWFVGDSEVDYATAQNAGVDCISVSWGFRTKEQIEGFGSKLIVDDAAELRKVLGI